MAHVAAHVTTFKGLQPGIDPRRIVNPYIVDGRNFYIGIDGAMSGFGYTTLGEKSLASPLFVKSFNVGADTFYFSGNYVYSFDKASGTYVPVFSFIADTSIAPWSHALVGGINYFIRKGAALIRYDESLSSWSQISGGSIPADGVGVARSHGRLVIVSPTWVSWSAIDDGEDFVASTVTGAGAQSLVIIGQGAGIAVKETTDGFLTYTESGILKSQLVNTINPYRHIPVSDTNQTVQTAISPFAIVEMANKEQVVLTKTGFYKLNGTTITPWQPLFGEYFRTAVFPTIDFSVDAVLQLTYIPEKQWFFVSFAENQESAVYTKAWCLYIPSGEWGSFDVTHTAFVHTPGTIRGSDNFTWGFLTYTGTLNEFTEEPFNLDTPELAGSAFIFSSDVSYPAVLSNDVYEFSTATTAYGEDTSLCTLTGVWDNYGVIYESPLNAKSPTEISMVTNVTGTSTVAHIGLTYTQQSKTALEAFIQVGPFTSRTEKDAERRFLINNVTIGMQAEAFVVTYDDWLLDYDEEVEQDWLLEGTDEDWTGAVGEVVDYTFTVLPTIDGKTSYALDTHLPEETFAQGKTRNFASGHEGVYNYFSFYADLPNQAFALKLISLDGIYTGKL